MGEQFLPSALHHGVITVRSWYAADGESWLEWSEGDSKVLLHWQHHHPQPLPSSHYICYSSFPVGATFGSYPHHRLVPKFWRRLWIRTDFTFFFIRCSWTKLWSSQRWIWNSCQKLLVQWWRIQNCKFYLQFLDHMNLEMVEHFNRFTLKVIFSSSRMRNQKI